MSNTKTRKLTVVRTSNQPLPREPGEAVHVGVDVPKASYSVAVYSDGRGVLTTRVQPARPEVLLERLRPIREAIAQVVYEAGPTGFALARRLRAEGYSAQVIAPSKLLAPVGPEAKSDRLDCRRLARLAAKGLLHPVRVPTEPEEADRQVVRLRDQLVSKTRSVRSQIKSFPLQHGIAEPTGLGHWSKASVAVLRGLAPVPEPRSCLDLLPDELAHAREQVRRVTARLKELAETERHCGAVAVMCSVPGVGVLTAAAFRLELPEPQRFDDGGQVARMVGLAPQVRRGGETRREGGLLKSGDARLRTVLVEAAWRWVRYDEAAARRYRQLVANTGSGKKAAVAMARRLGALLWRLIVHGEPYRAAAREIGYSCVDQGIRTACRVVSHRVGNSEDLRAGQTAFRLRRASTRVDRWRRPLATASLYRVPRARIAGWSSTDPGG
jgi:transposase